MSSAMDEFNAIIGGIDFNEDYEPMKCNKCEVFHITIRKSDQTLREAWGHNAYEYSLALRRRERTYERLGMHVNKEHMEQGDTHSKV